MDLKYHTSQAIVLRHINLSSADRVITVFTKDFGKLKAFAPGARRARNRFGGSLEPFTHTNILLLSRDGVYSILQSSVIEPFDELRRSLKKIILGFFLLELTERLIPQGSREQQVFLLLLSFLRWLKEREDLLIIYSFSLKLLSALGFRPVLDGCVRCKASADQMRLSPKEGGLVCKECSQDGVVVSSFLIRLMKSILSSDIEAIKRIKLDKDQVAQIEELLLINYLPYYLEGPLRSIKCFNLLR